MELDLVLAITEILDQIITVTPVFLDLDPEFEIDLGIQHVFALVPGVASDLFSHGSTLTDDDALV